MKKFLILMALMLCVSALLVSCNKNRGAEEEETEPQDNVQDNINMLVSELNKYETLDDLMKSESVTVDVDELVAEYAKISEAGSLSLNLSENGKNAGDLDAEYVMKNNQMYAKATADGETVGMNVSILNDNKIAYATWSQDNKGNIVVGESFSIDLDEIFEYLAENIENNFSLNINANDMPIDPKELKMPTITSEHITYADGKYMLDNNFLYDAFISTVDAVIDQMKNNGEELPEDFEEEYENIKKEGKKVLEAIDFEMYFLAKLENIEGMGMNLYFDPVKVADAIGEDKSDITEGDYLELVFETSTKGTDLLLKLMTDGNLNSIVFDYDYIYKGKKLCGFDLKYELENTSVTDDNSTPVDEYDEYYKNHKENYDKQSIEIMLDMSNIEKEDSTVFDFKANIQSDTDSYYEYGKEGIVADSQTLEVESLTVWNMSIKTTQANKANITMEMDADQKEVYNGQKTENKSSIGVDGTMEYSDKNIEFPEVDEDIKAALEKALKNPINPFE